MAKNVHKVPKFMWRKWDSNGQAMFNRLWDELSIEMCFPEGTVGVATGRLACSIMKRTKR